MASIIIARGTAQAIMTLRTDTNECDIASMQRHNTRKFVGEKSVNV
jgi:hypothetical protein